MRKTSHFNPLQKIHPSWHILFFSISIIVSCIIILIIRQTTFCSFYYLILGITVIIVSIIIARRWTIIFVLLGSFLIISARAGPDFIAQDYFKRNIGNTITVTGKISKDPTVSESSVHKLNIDLDNLAIIESPDSKYNVPGHLFLQTNKIDIARSDTITIRGQISNSFGSYYVTVFDPEILEIAHPVPGDIFLKIRNDFSDHIKKYIPSTEAGLGMGYLLGQKSEISSAIQDSLRTVGLTHIIVASGAHLSTLIGAVSKIFGKISRFANVLAAFIAMFTFLCITGLSASMLRACLVTGLSLVLKYFGREINPMRLILLVASITLIYNPFYLSDLSWLLSFSSFIGIMVFTPTFTKFFYGDKKPMMISATLISSISASLLVSPILLFFFGQISIITTLANILILPTVSIAMGLTFLTGFFAYFIPFAAQIVGQLSTLVMDYQISIANFLAQNESFLIKTGKENVWIFVLYIPVAITFFYCARKVHRNTRKQYKLAIRSP